jgi:hypothetical protein
MEQGSSNENKICILRKVTSFYAPKSLNWKPHSSIKKELCFAISKVYFFFFKLDVNVLLCALNLMDSFNTGSIFFFIREEGIILN